MRELEDTKCEVRRTIDLRLSIWDRSDGPTEEDAASPVGSPGYGGSSAPLGNFFEDATHAWLSSGPRLAVLDVKTGTSVGSWTFRDKVACVAQFPAQPGQVPLLLVGLDNGASKARDSSGMVCIFDCATSQVLRAIRMPAGVEQVCVVTGGAEWEDFGDKRVDNFIGENRGMACVALRNLDHLIVDLRRTSWEGPDATPVADESSPAELDFSDRNETSSSRHKYIREKHMAYNFMNTRLERYIGFNREEFESSSLYEQPLTSSMICSRKIGCLLSGCLGRIIIWQMDGAVRWVSPPMDDGVSVSDLALLEPTDDPRPFCYLWAAYREDGSRPSPILRMYAMLFERKYSDKGGNAYFNLEGDPSPKFELEIDEGNSITSLCPVVRESNPEQTESGNKRGEDSLLLITLNSRTLLFDLNQWYKEQMPRTIGECQNPNTFLASYRNENAESLAEDATINGSYLPASLREFPGNGPSPPEELFFPNSLSLEWIELRAGKLIFWMTRGLQADLLREMSIAGPVILIEPTETFHRCSSAGLIPNNAEVSFNSEKDLQREALLSLCLEQRWTQFLLQCAKDWSDGSASYLFHGFLRWGMQRVSSIKLTAHRLCVPLYDQSGSSIGEAEVKTLRFFAQQLECISSVVSNLLSDSVDLTKQKRAIGRISTYLQVLLWFYDVGLLPETQDIEDEATLPIGFSLKIPYPFEKLATIYREKREQFRRKSTKNSVENEKDLFIDELVSRECSPLESQWEREGPELSSGGNYPPSSLQSLLRSYLTDCYVRDSNETENKHQITMYLLMDLAMLLPGSCPGVDQLIKYPAAFKLSPSLIKLTQALWHLDHEDYHRFLEIITCQLVSDSDVKDWHHRLVLRTLIRDNQNKLALIYLRVRKPPLSSLDDQGTVISLSVEHGLVQSAFHRRPPSHYAQLLARFFQACKMYGRLNDVLHLALDSEEEEAFVKFLENEKSEDTRLLYYLQRCRYAEAGTVYPAGQPSGRGNSLRSKQPASLTIFAAYNATLPEITRKFSANLTRRVLDVDSESRYPRPMSHSKNRGKNREIHETVIRRAKETFLRGERSQIPFISAPCASLRAGNGNVETNRVLFVERAKKPYGKRTLDDTRDEDETNAGYNNGEERKRRKTFDLNETPDKTDGREIGSSMVLDTPLVKRKNQMINARNTPAETPHSILKSRQRMRNSASPGTDGRPSAEKVEEKERKPRQIRFSEGQRRVETSIEDPAENFEGNESLARGDVAEESDETEKSITKASSSEEREDDEESETFFSPDISGKTPSEFTVLSDGSFAGRSFSSGPRPRPSLKRSNASANDSSSDLLGRSLVNSSDASVKCTWTPTRSDSRRIPQSPRARASLLSTSIYSTSILSSDTSLDGTPVVKYEAKEIEETVGSFVERSVERERHRAGSPAAHRVSESFTRYTRGATVKTVSGETRDEYSGDGAEDKNSEVLMEVDVFGLDRDSDTRSRADFESNWDKRESISLTNTRSFGMPEESRTKRLGSFSKREEDVEMEEEEEDRETDVEEQRGDWNEKQSATTKIEDSRVNVGSVEETESSKPTDDCDDELIALKYEEDDEEEEEEEEEDENDDAFQSLSNSIEVEQRANEISIAAAENPTGNNGLYDKSKITSQEFNITDDESCNSAEASLTNESRNVNQLLEKTISVDKMGEDIADNVSNITDDESNGTRESSVFSSKIRRAKSSSQPDSETITNEEDSSLDSSKFSSRFMRNVVKKRLKKIDSEDTNRSLSSLAETMASNAESELSERETEGREFSPKKVGTRLSKIAPKSKSPRKRETAESTTPLRVTRSRRASSVAREVPASPLPESPRVKTRLRRASSIATDVFPSPDRKINRTPAMPTESPAKKSGLRRSVSLAKEIFAAKALDESLREEELPVRRSSRQAASAQREISEAPKTPVKVTRSSSKVSLVEENAAEETTASKRKTRTGRAASVGKESETAPKRSTRGASVAKDIPEENENVDETSAVKRSTRGASIAKDVPEENEKVSETSVVKRSTRGASVAKEIPEESENVAETSVVKRSTRGASVAKDISVESVDVAETSVVKRSTRGASVAKEIPEESEEISESKTKRTTRKRGSSVPKETEVGSRNPSQRARRGTSLSKDVILEENTESAEEGKKGRTIGGRVGSANPASPATSARSRLSSISSIPEEEEEEIFSAVARAKAGEKKRATSARERRAVSMDPPQVEVKRRTRTVSVKSAISEETIAEESAEAEVAGGTRGKGTRKASARRKRTVSVTGVREDDDDDVFEKLPVRRTRKLSTRSNESSDGFQFSPPDRAQDGPDDHRKEIGDVPDYVFSPPHTRSKHPSIQPRRKIKDFIPITDKERSAAKRVPRPRIDLGSIVRTTKTMDCGLHAVFILPKRSKSARD